MNDCQGTHPFRIEKR